MYTVMFIRETIHVEDEGDCAGAFYITTSTNKQETIKIIEQYVQDELHFERTNGNYGDWSVSVLYNGVMISDYNLRGLNFDVDDSTEHEDEIASNNLIDVSEIVQNIFEKSRLRSKFLRSLEDVEDDVDKKMRPVYLRIEKEKKERAELAMLLAKYPDMVNQNGNA